MKSWMRRVTIAVGRPLARLAQALRRRARRARVLAAVTFALPAALVFGPVTEAAAQTPAAASAQAAAAVPVPLVHYWVDASGQATLDDALRQPPAALQTLDRARSFELGRGALWLRLTLPALDAQRPWFLVMEGAAFTNRATFHQDDGRGGWTRQDAGDHLPVAAWSHPDRMPTFALDPTPGRTAWLRLENHPAPLSTAMRILDAPQRQAARDQSLLLLGSYLGFGLLVLFLGWVHVRLYGDRVFVAYCAYVACMLGFQIAFTGMGGLMFWPESPRWNDMAPALFMLWLTASGIWFVREVAAVSRHSRRVGRFATGWSLFGLLFPIAYFALLSPAMFRLLNLYGLLSVLLSFGLCIWAWRKGEVYAGWTALGFLPLHLAYPFPALRSAGVLPDSWLTQYAVLIGSAIEIPLLLYILHRRAKDYSENAARLRVIDSTDPLTGLALPPVLMLRLGDALKRARRYRTQCALALVELSNRGQLEAEGGRELADRALVVAAAQLTGLARELDTVSRVEAARFAVLLEAPYRAEHLKLFAQHVIAKGLAGGAPLPPQTPLRYRVVTIALPDWTGAVPPQEELDVTLLIDRLNRALDHLDAKKNVLHLPLAPGPVAGPPPMPTAPQHGGA